MWPLLDLWGKPQCCDWWWNQMSATWDKFFSQFYQGPEIPEKLIPLLYDGYSCQGSCYVPQQRWESITIPQSRTWKFRAYPWSLCPTDLHNPYYHVTDLATFLLPNPFNLDYIDEAEELTYVSFTYSEELDYVLQLLQPPLGLGRLCRLARAKV